MARRHYLATESRTLCGSLLSSRSKCHATWPPFLQAYEEKADSVCFACCRAARTYAYFGRGLADVNKRLDRSPPYLRKPRAMREL